MKFFHGCFGMGMFCYLESIIRVYISVINIARTVPWHLLYIANVNICFQQIGCKSMTKYVRYKMQYKCHKFGAFVKYSTDALME